MCLAAAPEAPCRAAPAAAACLGFPCLLLFTCLYMCLNPSPSPTGSSIHTHSPCVQPAVQAALSPPPCFSSSSPFPLFASVGTALFVYPAMTWAGGSRGSPAPPATGPYPRLTLQVPPPRSPLTPVLCQSSRSRGWPTPRSFFHCCIVPLCMPAARCAAARATRGCSSAPEPGARRGRHPCPATPPILCSRSFAILGPPPFMQHHYPPSHPHPSAEKAPLHVPL